MNLQWQGLEGKWYDEAGQLVAFDPSTQSRGPKVLLLQREALIKFLDSNGLTLFWTLLGEKGSIGGPMSEGDYKGRLEINGAYFLDGETVSGKTHSKYMAPS